MKKFIFIISFLFLHTYFCVGQTQQEKNPGRVENLKIAYMNKELNLTPEEAEKFWPVYNNYFSEIKQARKENLNDELAFDEKAVEIRKKYKANFKNILNSDERVNRVFVSEKKLRDLLKRELQYRQHLRKYPKQVPSAKQPDKN